MMLEKHLRTKLVDKDLLLMTHLVLGYPDFETCRKTVGEMVAAGVDLIELQIPFSEPMADGPVILRANQDALAAGARVEACLDVAAELAAGFDVPFLIMTYFNIVYRYGVERMADRLQAAGIAGAIVPDLPPEEADGYPEILRQRGLAPIYLFSPTSTDARMARIAEIGEGFVYCVARKGVTGAATTFSDDLAAYLARCRRATRLPLAVGFGVRERADVEFLRGKADIAVVGSETLRVLDTHGVSGVGAFLRGLIAA